MAFCGVCVCACARVLVYCVQYNGWHGNILKSYKHLVVVAVYYRLKFAVNDLCIKIFKQMYFVWEQCLSNSNYTLLKHCLLVQQSCSNRVIEGFAVCKRFPSKMCLHEYLHSRIMSDIWMLSKRGSDMENWSYLGRAEKWKLVGGHRVDICQTTTPRSRIV